MRTSNTNRIYLRSLHITRARRHIGDQVKGERTAVSTRVTLNHACLSLCNKIYITHLMF